MKTPEIPIIVTPVGPDDALGVRQVFYKTWLDTYPNEELGITREMIEQKFKDYFSVDALRAYAEKLAHQPAGWNMFVAKMDDVIAGVSRTDTTLNKLSTLYVLPEYQRKGIGRLLWEQARQTLDPRQDILVDVATYNQNAIDFYQKLGFEDTGRRFFDENPIAGDIRIPEMEMRIKAVTQTDAA